MSDPTPAEGASRPTLPVAHPDAPTASQPPDLAAQPTITDPGALLTPAVPPPESFGGYEILGELGRGGMGVVYRARHVGLQRVVALKMVPAGAAASPTEVRRLIDEAVAAAGLDHPNIVPIYEVGEANGHHYYTMKLIDGGSLHQRRPPMTNLKEQRAAARLMAAVARAVHHAHQHRILHRDLKPGNILLDARGEPHVADFGLAKRLAPAEGQDAAPSPTQESVIVGTPSYMAPEQAAGQDLTTAVDVWALGAVLYDLLTGRPPFRGDSAMTTILQVMTDDPPSPRQVNPRVSRDLETVCLVCLSKEPERRYASAAALADDLERFADGRPIQARPVGTWGRLVRWARRHPALAALLLVTALATGTLVGGYVLMNAERRREAEAREQKVRRTLYAAHMKLAQQSLDAGHVEPALDLLRGYLPGGRHAPLDGDGGDLRCFEWYFFWRLCHQDRFILRGHTAPAYAAAYSPDGKTLATAGADGTVRLWDPVTGTQTQVFKGGDAIVYAAAFAPDGRSIVSGSGDGTLRLWRLSGGEPLVINAHKEAVTSVAFTPDGKTLLSGSQDATVKLWDAATGREQGTLRRENAASEWVTCLALTADGKRLAAGGLDGVITLWDLPGKRPMQALTGHSDWVWSVAFAPGGMTLASGSFDDTVRLWDVTSGKELPPVSTGKREAMSVAFAPDGKTLAIGGRNGGLKLIDLATGKERAALRGHTGPVNAVTFTRDGTALASAGGDRTVMLWDPVAARAAARRQAGAERGPSRRILQGHADAVLTVAFSPDGKTLATGGRAAGELLLWDLASDRPPRKLAGHTGPVTDVAFARSDPLLASSSRDGTVRIWDLRGDREPAVLRGGGAEVSTVAFSPDGRWLAAAGMDRTVRVWEVSTQKLIREISGKHAGGVSAINFSPDGTLLATGSYDKTLRLWDTATWAERATLRGHMDWINALAFARDGRRLATASDDTLVKIWDPGSGKELVSLAGHTGWVTAVDFAPDGGTVATGSDDLTVRLWDPETGLERASLTGHRGAVRGVAFSPDQMTLASCGEDGLVILWQRAAAEEVAEPPR